MSVDTITPPIDIFFGAGSSTEARLYVRAPRPAGDQAISLGGEVKGPYCSGQRTLPARFPLMDRGPGKTLLAEAMIPDPCFWTREFPAYYQVNLEILATERRIAFSRQFGLRTLGAKGKSFRWNSNRFVLRGVSCARTDEQELMAWKEASAAMIVESPSDQLCRQADELGVLLVARISEMDENLGKEIRRLAQFASVGMAIFSGGQLQDPAIKSIAPNLLFGELHSHDHPPTAGLAADFIVIDCPAGALSDRGFWASQFPSIPIVIGRNLTEHVSLAKARAGCDWLQRECASSGEFAGYVML